MPTGPAASRPRILTAINQKGGVGKTALACHLAFAAREAGLRTLLVDFDTQGTASTILSRDLSLTKRDGGAELLFLAPERIAPLATPSRVDLLHGHQHLDLLDRASGLEEAPRVWDVLRELDYDLVVIDTPPALGIRHLGPLLWADCALAPLEPTGASVQGLAQTRETLTLVQRMNPAIRFRVIINRHIRRSRSQRETIALLEKLVPLERPFLTQRVAVADALDAGVPVWHYRRAPLDLRQSWLQLTRGLLDGRTD